MPKLIWSWLAHVRKSVGDVSDRQEYCSGLPWLSYAGMDLSFVVVTPMDHSYELNFSNQSEQYVSIVRLASAYAMAISTRPDVHQGAKRRQLQSSDQEAQTCG